MEKYYYTSTTTSDVHVLVAMTSPITKAAVVKRTQTQFGKHVFSVCGPSIWNHILSHTRNLHSVQLFAKLLKRPYWWQISSHSLWFSHSTATFACIFWFLLYPRIL